MLKRFTNCILLFLAVLLIKTTAWAQSSVDSSSNYQINPAYTNIVTDFYKKVGPQSRLYNGVQYDFYDPAIKGNAYFEDVNNWTKGSVFYDGYFYSNVDLMYDIYTDQLVMLLYNHFLKISLITERVASFDLLGNHFIYIKNDPTNSSSLNTGFYDELYKGKIQVLAKYSKSKQTSGDIAGSLVTFFSPTKDYYLFKGGKYYTVNSQGAFFDALSDHKKEIKQFLKNNNIKFKSSPEQNMVKIATYYDSLTN